MKPESDDEISEGSYEGSSRSLGSVPIWVEVKLFFRRLIFFHPIILAPLLTASFVLALFSTLHCDFIVINIGFDPLNEYVKSRTLSLCPLVGEYYGGCYLYSSDFQNEYITNDRNWAFAKIASFTSMGGGFLSFILVWMMFLGAIDHVGHPKSVLELFICVLSLAECGKLLWFKKVDVCKAKMWIRKAVDGVSIEVANSCEFGKGAKLSLWCFLINIVALIILYYVDAYRPYDQLHDLEEDLESAMTENGTVDGNDSRMSHKKKQYKSLLENEDEFEERQSNQRNHMRRASSESILLKRVPTRREETRRATSEKTISWADKS